MALQPMIWNEHLGISELRPACCVTYAAQTAAQSVVDTYADMLSAAYTGHMAAKLGLLEYHKPLAVGLVTLMQEDKADFTNTFRCRWPAL